MLYNTIYAIFIDYTSTFMYYFEIFIEYVAGRDLPTYIIWLILAGFMMMAFVEGLIIIAAIAVLATIIYNENKLWFDTEGVSLFWYYYNLTEETINVTIPYYIDVTLCWIGEVMLLLNDTEEFLKKYGIVPERKEEE